MEHHLLWGTLDALVIWPVYIPLPYFISRPCRKVWAKISLSKNSRDEQCSSKLKQPERRQPVGTLEMNSHELQGGLPNTPIEKDERYHIPLDLRTAPVVGVLLILASTCIPGGVVRRGIIGSGGVKPYDIMVLFVCFVGLIQHTLFWYLTQSYFRHTFHFPSTLQVSFDILHSSSPPGHLVEIASIPLSIFSSPHLVLYSVTTH